jgi:hypothetical protein
MAVQEIMIGLFGTGMLALVGWFCTKTLSKLDSIGTRLTVLETTMKIKCS